MRGISPCHSPRRFTSLVLKKPMIHAEVIDESQESTKPQLAELIIHAGDMSVEAKGENVGFLFCYCGVASKCKGWWGIFFKKKKKN
jgi:hypothetical protein